MAEAEAIARALSDPAILSRALQTRAAQHGNRGQLDVAETLAGEALHWATAAGDDWATAMAAFSKAMAASTVEELRQRVDRAASLLAGVGNVYHLADMLSSAAYAALSLGSDSDAEEFIGRAIPIARELDDRHTWMFIRGNFGLSKLLTGEADAAGDAFREELTLCRELVILPIASEGLGGLAAIAVVRGDLDRAARLFGAAASHRYGQPEHAVDARLEATFFEPARTLHGADAWNAAAREGGALSFEDAIAYALEEPSH
jgi:hypothetical protein